MPISVIPDSHLDLLDKPILAHVATIGPNGEPQSNPVWFLSDRTDLVISIGPSGQKALNLQRDPRIALSMADPDNPIHYLEIRGEVASVMHVDSQHPFIVGLVRKYTGKDTYDGMPDEHALVYIDPVHTTSMA